MFEQRKHLFQRIANPAGHFFSRFRLPPNFYTLLTLPLAALTFWFLVRNNLAAASVFFLLAILFDVVDGAVARTTATQSKIGAYLDTICDRYVEALSLLGFLFLPLPDLVLPAKAWIFLSLTGGLLTTYAKAAAKEKNLVTEEIWTGFFGRPERAILIFLSMVLGLWSLSFTAWGLAVLAIVSNFTALERIISAIRRAR